MVNYKISCLRTSHTVKIYHIKVKVAPHVPRRHGREIEVLFEPSATIDLVSAPANLCSGKRECTSFTEGWVGLGVSLDWSEKPETTGVQTRTVQPVASR